MHLQTTFFGQCEEIMANQPATLEADSNHLAELAAHHNQPAVLVAHDNHLAELAARGNQPAAVVSQTPY